MSGMVGYDLNLDWLGFTYRKEVSDDVNLFYDCFLADFPEINEITDSMVILDKGRFHYEYACSFNENILIMFDSSSYKGVNVQIPSHALCYFMGIMHCDSCQQLFKILKDRSCRPSRIDICFDDYTKTFRPMDYAEWWLATINYSNYCPVRFKTYFNKANIIPAKGDSGSTFYLGTRGKNRFMRIYDKDLESNGEIDAVRYEFEYHGNGALAIFDEIIETNKLDFVNVLCSFFTLVDNEGNEKIYNSWERKYQYNNYKVWFDWLEKVKFSEEFIEVSIPKYKRSEYLLRSMEWIEKCCLKSIALYIKAYGSSCLLEKVKFVPFDAELKRKLYDLQFLILEGEKNVS